MTDRLGSGRLAAVGNARTLAAIAATGGLVFGLSAIAMADVACPGSVCQGTPASEVLTGTPEIDYIYAGDGDDTLFGRRSFDDIRGEDGDDDLDGGRGNDQYQFVGNSWDQDRITGDAGGNEDWLIFQGNTAGVIAHLAPASGQVEVTSGLNSIQIAKGVEIEWLQASGAPDQVFGSARDEYLAGADDDDLLVGGAGDDDLLGDFDVFSDVGNDTFRAGKGEDTVQGVDGNDTIFVRDGEKDLVDCGDGTDTVAESDGKDVIGANCETIVR